MSFAFVDQQSRMLQGVQQTLLFVSVAALLINNKLHGADLKPKFENNPFDNLERYGTQGNFKGSQVPWTPPEGAGERSWYKPDGKISYPPNKGAIPGTQETVTLQSGEKFGRYGIIKSSSNYVAIAGTDSTKLALPPDTDPAEYYEFEILKPIPWVIKSTVMEWPSGSGTGGGVQFELPMPTEELRHLGYIE